MINDNSNGGRTTAAVIETRNLTKQFDEQVAVDRIDLRIPAGKIFGFIGPSGCGKTTTVRLLLGVYRPTAGDAFVFGRRPMNFSRSDRERIGYMPQKFVLDPTLSAWENLNFAASLYSVSWRRHKRLHALLDLVELRGHEGKKAEVLSGGMLRRLSLAAALVHDPRLLFLDEPTAGIDPVLRRKFWDYFGQLQSEGRTLFITTQYVNEAAYCDYVGVMAAGRVLMVETPEDLRRRASGGEVVEVRLADPLPHEMRSELANLPLVQGELEYISPTSWRLIVDDASEAIPDLMEWFQAKGMEVESLNEYAVPFDDVFVKLIEEDRNHG